MVSSYAHPASEKIEIPISFKDAAIDCDDRVVESALRTAGRVFSRPIDRSKPFRIPVVAVVRLAAIFLPRLFRHGKTIFS